MLMPCERAQAINLLTVTYINGGQIRYGGQELNNMLMYGHKGFASYTDHELLRAIQTLAKKTNSYEVQNFISTIAADKFVLE